MDASDGFGPHGPSPQYGEPPDLNYRPPPAAYPFESPPPVPQQYQQQDRRAPSPAGGHSDPPGAGYPPGTGIAVTTKYDPLRFTYAFTRPKIYVDGYPMPVAGWGRTVWPIRPGTHLVSVRGLMGAGKDAPVQVLPGQLVELEYHAPGYPYREYLTVVGLETSALGMRRPSYNVGLWIGLATAAIAITLSTIITLILLARG